MKVWHFTPASRVDSILRTGLSPRRRDGKGATNTPGIYVVEPGDDRSGFIRFLYGEPVACLEIDTHGLSLISGDDDEEDRPEWAIQQWVPPAWIRVVTP